MSMEQGRQDNTQLHDYNYVSGYEGAVGYDPTVEEREADRITDDVLVDLTRRLPEIEAAEATLDRDEQERLIHEAREIFIGGHAMPTETATSE